MTILVRVKLTDAEAIVYNEIVNTGDCAKRIAARVNMSPTLVKKHSGNILRRFNIDKQTQLIVSHYKGILNAD